MQLYYAFQFFILKEYSYVFHLQAMQSKSLYQMIIYVSIYEMYIYIVFLCYGKYRTLKIPTSVHEYIILVYFI